MFRRRYGHESAMSATFNSAGTKILGLRKRLPPVLYDVSSPVKVVCFPDLPNFRN